MAKPTSKNMTIPQNPFGLESKKLSTHFPEFIHHDSTGAGGLPFEITTSWKAIGSVKVLTPFFKGSSAPETGKKTGRVRHELSDCVKLSHGL